MPLGMFNRLKTGLTGGGKYGARSTDLGTAGARAESANVSFATVVSPAF
jgi:hypothetical protein